MNFDDLIGGSAHVPIETAVARSNSAPKSDASPKAKDRSNSLKVADMKNVIEGVSIQWLQKAFRMTRGKVEHSLMGCPVLNTTSNGDARYDLPTAASYLVKPAHELQVFLKNLKAADLPETLRESFWNAKLKEMKYRVAAQELWPTESVMEVLSDAFQTIKKTAMLWTDTIEETIGMTDEQRKLQMSLVDTLMEQIQDALVKNAKSTTTESFVQELEDDI